MSECDYFIITVLDLSVVAQVVSQVDRSNRLCNSFSWLAISLVSCSWSSAPLPSTLSRVVSLYRLSLNRFNASL